jgi:hypothetical protein
MHGVRVQRVEAASIRLNAYQVLFRYSSTLLSSMPGALASLAAAHSPFATNVAWDMAH